MAPVPWVHEGPSNVVPDDDEAKLPEYEKAMSLMQRCVANGKRDLAEADAAAVALKDIDEAAEANKPSDQDTGTRGNHGLTYSSRAARRSRRPSPRRSMLHGCCRG